MLNNKMFLSKIFIPWRYAKNSYDLHRALWLCFPDRPNDIRNFLFRVENSQKGIGVEVLMQSDDFPQPVGSEVTVLKQREYLLNLRLGQRLRFRLRANPVKAVKDSRKGTVERNGKVYSRSARVPLVCEEQQRMWLVKKLEMAARLESLIIQQEPPLYFRKVKSTEKSSGKIQPVLFDGLLSVADAEIFYEMIHKGIGPAKSFGCGLLSLALV